MHDEIAQKFVMFCFVMHVTLQHPSPPPFLPSPGYVADVISLFSAQAEITCTMHGACAQVAPTTTKEREGALEREGGDK